MAARLRPWGQLASIGNRALHRQQQQQQQQQQLITSRRCSCLPSSAPSSAAQRRPLTSATRLLLRDRSPGPPPPRTYFQPGDQPPPPQYQPIPDQLFQQQSQSQSQPLQQHTAPPPPPAPPSQYAPGATSNGSQPSPPPPRRRRRRRYWLRYLIFGSLVTYLAYSRTRTLWQHFLPADFPRPNTPHDARYTAALHLAASRLDLVRALSADPAWESWNAYSPRPSSPPPPSPDPVAAENAALAILLAPTSGQRPERLTTGPLAGARGIGGYQRVFANRETGEVVSVVYLGPHVTGWPGVVHGGLLATVLDESLGRCAVQKLAGGTGVTARLDVEYRSPTLASQFAVVRCEFVPEDEIPAGDRGKQDRKVWCRGRVETLKGRVLVEAKALFVAPRNIELEKISDKF